MFNPQRIETIRKNVKISTLLSDHEKSDWLNLLELMNDKQLGELEDILGSDPNVAKTPSQSQKVSSSKPLTPAQPNFQNQPAHQAQPIQTDSVQQLPPLSHIANMPTDITMTHSVPVAPPVSSQPLKPLPRTTPSPSLSSLLQKPSYAKPVNSTTATKAPVSTLMPTSAKAIPSPVTSSVPPTQPKQQPQAQAVYSISEPGELQKLNLESLRQYTFQSIYDSISKVIQANGYFQILQLIELSPLYASYIAAGKERLGAPAQQLTLTQEEFEFMTDLLRNIRFNR